MEDFIFGTLSTDQLKLNYLRTANSGIQHRYQMNPLDPQPGEGVTIQVETGPDVAVENMAGYFTLDGSQPDGSKGEAIVGEVVPFKRVSVEWDTLLWGYRSRWEAELPPQEAGTEVSYVISAWGDAQEEIFADWPDVKLTIEKMAKYYFDGQPLPDLAPLGDHASPQVFSYWVDKHQPPLWAKKAVIYHIFVDRFFPGQGRDWHQTEDLRETFGGTLWGIAEKLDHIQALGATAIWLSPIFPSPTIHRYDATDYFRVSEGLGGDDALRNLIDQAHQKGIRIILDLVCNHVSNEHPYFVEAQGDVESPYRDWFFFNEEEAFGYRTFFGVPSMPQVNLNHPGAREWMLDAARYWINEFDIDGYRLDHATGPGPSFWGEFWRVCKQLKSDSICIGEVVEPPDIQRQYYGRMDGLLDFHLCEAIRRTIGTKAWPEARFVSFLSGHQTSFPDDFLMASFLDNHDMDRFSFIAGGDEDALKNAAALQFQLPGPPVIYYGTEIGLKQKISKTSAVGLEASRGKMLWGDAQNKELFNFYQSVITERMKSKPWEQQPT